jgi:transitional endoplasmic reticulum ATPase
VSHQIPDVSFDDIGGLDEAKRALRRTVEWPLTKPELLEAVDIDPSTGLLLYGPPGTGKTLLARAVASTSDANFIPVDGPEIMDRYVGESERAVRQLFDRARANAPTVIFFDEIDAIGTTRSSDETSQAAERVVSQLLTELDGVEGRDGVFVIGATNRPDLLDDALLRPGRFDRTVSIGMPDVQAREEIFRVHTASHAIDDVHRRELAEQTDGYTGSDIAAVVREAGLLAVEEAMEASPGGSVDRAEIQVTPDHYARALKQVEPSLTPAARRRHESLDRFE